MRVEEAIYIKSVLDIYTGENEDLKVLLNLGSGTDNYRRVQQPHIDREIFSKLHEDQYKVINFDLKEDIGVDISGNIFDETTQNRLKTIKPSIIICCNLFEHLELDLRDKIYNIIDELLEINGTLIITVPYSYPLHFDPIDTYFRPSPQEISSLFPEFMVLEESIVNSTNFFIEYMSYNLYYKLKLLIRLCMPFYKYNDWKALAHRLKWLFSNYKVSCVTLRKI